MGASVYTVVEGQGRVNVGSAFWDVERGDVFVVPSWQQLRLESENGMDLFRFSDTPIFERLDLGRHRAIIEETRGSGRCGTSTKAFAILQSPVHVATSIVGRV